MPVQPQEHDLSGATQSSVKLPRYVAHNGTLRRPSTAPNSTSPCVMLPPSPRLGVVPQKAGSRISHDDSLSGIFSRLCNLGTNTRKPKEIIPPVHNQGDSALVHTSRKLSLRRPPRRSSSSSFVTQTSSSQHATTSTARLVIPQPSLSTAGITPKSPTINSPFIPDHDGDDREESGDETSPGRQKEVRLQMARLAKLRRHLGEDIPPEMVLSPTVHVDTAKSRGPAESLSHPKEVQEGQQSLDSTAYVLSAPAPQNSRLRKSRSLRDRKRVFEIETHSDHAVEVVQKRIPLELHVPWTEVDLSEPLEHASVSTPHDVQRPLHSPCLPMSLASTTERSQICDNLFAADLVPIDKPLNTKDGETGLERSADINPRTRPVQSLHSAKNVGIHPSLSAHTPSYPVPELEVSVKISRRTRFWQGKNGTQSASPDDITKQLRAMKAST